MESTEEDAYWYHTIRFPDGCVTAGEYDHQKYLKYYGIPDDLTGWSALDVGASNGFFAFEFERRGARPVVAVDLPEDERLEAPSEQSTPHPFRNFSVAKVKLGSQVEYRFYDVLNLSAKNVGRYDLVFAGSLLLHVSDPLRALRAIRQVTKRLAIIATAHYPDPALKSYEWSVQLALRVLRRRRKVTFAAFLGGDVFWLPTRRGLAHLASEAGFSDVRVLGKFRLDTVDRRRGFPHLVLHAKP